MLEYWNDGIMGDLVLNNVEGGKMGQRFIDRKPIENDIGKKVSSFKNQHSIIPLFHYSMCEAKTSCVKKSAKFKKLWKPK